MEDMNMNNTPMLITISRQLGSGGSFIGRQLAEQLGIFYIDRQIVIGAAKKLHVLEEEVEVRDEKKTSFWESLFASFASFPSSVAYALPESIPSDQDIYDTESEVIEEIAKEHSAVIIGRGGSYLLRDYPQHLSIFLHARPSFRQQRIEKLYNLSAEDAKRRIEQSDRERSDYHTALTGQDWLDARHYHLSIDTEVVGLEQAKELILSCIHSKVEQNK